MKVEIYSDVVCPWCYIGERRFERALAGFEHVGEVEVEFRPFQLDPDAPAESIPLKSYLARRFGGSADGMLRNVSDAAGGEGISIDWENAKAVNTRDSHRLLELASREYGRGVQRSLLEHLFAAHFSEGGDVGDLDCLTELGVAAGMDEERVKGYLESGEGAEELTQELERARSLGIRAVPAFLFEGKYVIEGAQPSSTFLQVLEEVQQRLEHEKGDPVDADCDDGVCAAREG
ncbi:MAG: DsbA family oxidoreductase [Gemmatimonadota bacterium]